ncbi:hypothetical protein FO488_01660 [Geobacter sp. FeAm09]|uniref:hypothetical protein n=1 Tax=Geobacter sp. FeAm09 TaxID=2597769 RepID=UPI0011EF4973|nr:hypothetical protein [Geobacter sp. FeAm09]QEM66990.1 hypothetical protein FO488_01660 [Geobacter sp. FeAm09]
MVTTHDIVLIHVDGKPGFYARIEELTPDVKPGWWQVRLMVFTFPLQMFTWILDEFQLDGADFTMGGTPIRMEQVVSPVEQEQLQQEQDAKEQRERSAHSSGNPKVISLSDRRKK